MTRRTPYCLCEAVIHYQADGKKSAFVPKRATKHKERPQALGRIGALRVGDVSESLEYMKQAKSAVAADGQPGKERLGRRPIFN
jgi:hypothetical protein